MTELKMKSVIVFLSLLFTWSASLVPAVGAQNQLLTFSKDEKQVLLDAHNMLRARTARGDTGGQPSAADMMLMEWDDRIADTAAAWVAECTPMHDLPRKRLVPGVSWVGQNLGFGATTNMTQFVQLWYNEFKDYKYEGNNCTPGEMCGHYTQVVWSHTLLVGCAAAQCGEVNRNFVCNYAVGGNMGKRLPYVSGKPATQCAAEYTFTSGNLSLCLRKDQCPDGGCRCAITCMNGGTFDEARCNCTCPPEFYGTRCELPCDDDTIWIPNCTTDPTACESFPLHCSRTCKLCRNSDIRIKNAVNKDGVIARVIGN